VPLSKKLPTVAESTKHRKPAASKPSKKSQPTTKESTKQRSSTTQKPSKAKHPKHVETSDADAIAMEQGTYMHEELAERGYSQRDEAVLTEQKLAAYCAQKGHDESEDDDDSEEDNDDDDEDQLEEDDEDDEDEDEDEEDQEAGRPRRPASSDPRNPAQDTLLDELLGPDADSSHPNGNFRAHYEDCTLASLYCIY
jgi:hypothetical protein